MDSLAYYGSDDDCEGSADSEKTRGGSSGRSCSTYRSHTPEPKLDPDVNYEEVQMDLSEESSSTNNSPKCEERKSSTSASMTSGGRGGSNNNNKDHQPSDRSSSSRSRRSRSRDGGDKDDYNTSSSGSTRRSKGDSDRYSSRKSGKDSKESYDSSRESKSRFRGDSRRDRDGSPKRENKSRNDKYNRDGREEGSRDRNGRKRSRSRDRRRSSSRDRDSRRARSRSRSKERDHRRPSDNRDRKPYNKRFERATNKIAQLEKLGIEIKTPDCQFVTPKELQRSLEDQKCQVPTTVQPVNKFGIPGLTGRFAEQIRKRKLLWQKKPNSETEALPPMSMTTPAVTTEQSSSAKMTLSQKMQQIQNPACDFGGAASGGGSAGAKPPAPIAKVWENTTFAQDQDGKQASKFKRLMGIRSPTETPTAESDIMKKQEEMFHSMEQQYEIARTATHTMRGVGLGFGSFQR